MFGIDDAAMALGLASSVASMFGKKEKPPLKTDQNVFYPQFIQQRQLPKTEDFGELYRMLMGVKNG